LPALRDCATLAAAGAAKALWRVREGRMDRQTDRNDRRLVKMSADEFAEGRADQGWYNRDALFMALIVLWVIGMSIYHFFFAAA
jgi:hypothetical protein